MLFLVTTVKAAFTIKVAGAGREEIVSGEFNLSENIARLVRCVVALLFGYTKVIYRYKHLDISDKLNDCEKTKCDINC